MVDSEIEDNQQGKYPLKKLAEGVLFWSQQATFHNRHDRQMPWCLLIGMQLAR